MNNKKLNFDEIKQFISFEELFQNSIILSELNIASVKLDKKKSSRNSKEYEIDGETIIVFPKGRNGYPSYFNRGNDKDRGDIIQFVANRLNETGNLAMVRAGKLIQNAYQGDFSQLKPIEAVSSENEIKPFRLEEFREKNLTPIDSYNVSFINKERGIDPKTFDVRLFRGTVFTYNPFDNNSNVKNIFFAKKDFNGEIKGAEIKLKAYQPNQNTNLVEGDPKLLYTSNLPSQVDNIIICESGLDCLSHYQIHKNPNTFYISSNGNLYQERIDRVFEILEEHDIKDKPLIIAGDNDYGGLLYDLRLANRLLPDGNEFSVSKNKEEVILKYQDTNVSPQVKDYLEHIKLKINEEEMSLNTNINSFVEIKEDENSVSLEFPKKIFDKNARKISISLFSKIDILKDLNLKVQKPRQNNKGTIKDWNDYSTHLQKVEKQKLEKGNKKFIGKNR